MEPPPLPKAIPQKPERKQISRKRNFLWGLLLLPFALVTLASAADIIHQFKIPTGAMRPNLPPGTHLVAEKASLWFTEPERGEVVVFTTRDIDYFVNQSLEAQYYIMRLIGLPGDTLFVREGVLHVNNEPFHVHEPGGTPLLYDASGNLADGKSYRVPENSYFMMGDNSSNSLDSRFWGPAPKGSVKYRYWFTYFFDKSVERKRLEREEKIRKQRQE